MVSEVQEVACYSVRLNLLVESQLRFKLAPISLITKKVVADFYVGKRMYIIFVKFTWDNNNNFKLSICYSFINIYITKSTIYNSK